LDIGASRGWVQAKGTTTVRHILNGHNNRTGRGGACPKARCGGMICLAACFTNTDELHERIYAPTS
jgi:hypothetical protein